ncbi:tRNA (adenosine(37)-N6)-dimethylallyltransferase MiaA [Aurantimonas sp. 22II-16-19i]|uniref:tRNA (adenosine(37)-N6)-dimethylallyltransferase MiaA n=1 Tax=Aurantimonas sp. 22II-16-19i TaxID=1317114 RepID=UPI0009F7DCB0|nr:tRNA (adenosine(37)-N6)-dimethylallyltransferase MiaA [Aurantimonas sp. 22II-16-19i]ORE92761.1 tRNA delta(2)-isopentenylpyrophosphate transferase [Aurantimonas sp. 22II-16-19i]
MKGSDDGAAMTGEFEAILIAGPTASGKSRLAVELAERHGGAVVNADSLQVYDGLEILTARPSPKDLVRVPHHLYGHVDPRSDYSAGAWLRDAARVLEALRAEGRLPIFCGGTGLYFKALLGLLDAMPAVPAEIRAQWRERLATHGPAALHDELSRRDPVAAARLDPADGQRIARALEVGETVGKPLSELQTGRGEGLIEPDRSRMLVLAPDRAVLRQRIADRFDRMLEEGALDEVRRFEARFPAAGATAGKAIGLSELSDFLKGRKTYEEARERAIIRTRQYAKRQETWFRHQFDGRWRRIGPRDAVAT